MQGAAPPQPAAVPPSPAAAPTPAADTLPPAEPTPPLPQAVVANEPPVGRPTDVPPRSRPAARPDGLAPDPAVLAALAARRAEPPVVHELEVEPEPEPVPEPPPPPAEDAGVLDRPPPGAPLVQVNFLVYSRKPERRTVALTVNNGYMITLHEGETDNGIEVARILPDRIHARYQGTVFVVYARD
jgi:hypothetical protein